MVAHRPGALPPGARVLRARDPVRQAWHGHVGRGSRACLARDTDGRCPRRDGCRAVQARCAPRRRHRRDDEHRLRRNAPGTHSRTDPDRDRGADALGTGSPVGTIRGRLHALGRGGRAPLGERGARARGDAAVLPKRGGRLLSPMDCLSPSERQPRWLRGLPSHEHGERRPWRAAGDPRPNRGRAPRRRRGRACRRGPLPRRADRRSAVRRAARRRPLSFYRPHGGVDRGDSSVPRRRVTGARLGGGGSRSRSGDCPVYGHRLDRESGQLAMRAGASCSESTTW